MAGEGADTVALGRPSVGAKAAAGAGEGLARAFVNPQGCTDVLVVGGGPAGLATAIGARLAGLSVQVIDRRLPPIDKACGEGLMPDAVARLAALGVSLPETACCRFRGIRYIDGAVVAEGTFRGAGGLGVRRTVLHQALVERAADVGVGLGWGISALGLQFPSSGGAGGAEDPRLRGLPEAVATGAVTSHGLFEARWIVGADGLRSRLRAWAGLAGGDQEASSEVDANWASCGEAAGQRRHPQVRSGASPARRFGVRRHFAVRPWSDRVEVYWGTGCEAYVTPVAPEEVGVALLWGDDLGKVDFSALLSRFPALPARLAGAAPTSRQLGCGPLRRRVPRVVRGNVALVGDAAGYLDAITGEGIAVALHQAAALAAALADAAADRSPDLRSYATAQARIGRLPNFMTSLVLALERRPWLRQRAIRALAAEPAIFSRLLGIHARELRPANLGFDGAARLVYRLVTA